MSKPGVAAAEAALAAAAKFARRLRAQATKYPADANLEAAATEAEAATSGAAKLARRAASRAAKGAIKGGKGKGKSKKKKSKKAQEAYPCEKAVIAMGQAMATPYFSLIAFADKNQSYMTTCGSIAHNAHIPFEIVFVGPNPPTEAMPSNFKYIQTNVKPAQCLEIAARNAVGEYLIVGSDNLQFSAYFLNKLFVYTLRLQHFNILIGSRLQQGDEFLDESLVFDTSISNSPVIVMAPTIKRNVWNSLGGIDARFSSFNNLDMQMRCFESGMTPLLIPDCSVSKFEPDPPDEVQERELLNSFWIKDGEISKSRLAPVESFTELA